jgi:two-component system probable response regulator PhcQ
MSHPASPYQQFAIIYVDDEVQSLKYFPKLFPDFRILTAESVDAAKRLIEAEGDGLAIVLTDQRMPGASGTDLLAHLHLRRPEVVRILTTAYSDLDSAIAAVNSGAVYRYVVKPWDQADLRQTLMRAYEFFILQRERNKLLREKISVLQRMFIMDRVRSYAVLAAGLAGRVQYSLQALKAFLDAAPVPAQTGKAEAAGGVDWNELWAIARVESSRMIETIQGVAQRTIEPRYTFTALDAPAVIRSGLAPVIAQAAHRSVTVTWDGIPMDLPGIRADATMLARMAGIMLDRLLLVDRDARAVRVRLQATEVWGQQGLRLSVTADDRVWEEAQLHACFTVLSGARMGSPGDQDGDLLAAYFIAYHHGGTMAIHRTTPQGPGFVACLPVDPEVCAMPGVDPQWLERTFTWFEG